MFRANFGRPQQSLTSLCRCGRGWFCRKAAGRFRWIEFIQGKSYKINSSFRKMCDAPLDPETSYVPRKVGSPGAITYDLDSGQLSRRLIVFKVRCERALPHCLIRSEACVDNYSERRFWRSVRKSGDSGKGSVEDWGPKVAGIIRR